MDKTRIHIELDVELDTAQVGEFANRLHEQVERSAGGSAHYRLKLPRATLGELHPQGVPMLLVIGETNSSWAGRPAVARQFPSRQKAEEALAEYVRRNWEHDGMEEPMPEDPDEMVSEYFGEVDERYEIICAPESMED
jgi:hypothetical protein